MGGGHGSHINLIRVKGRLDAQLADVLAAGKQGTGKPVMGWLVRTGALGRVTLLLPIRGSTWD